VPAATARLKDGPNGRTVRLFKQGSGDWEGLMPVAVEDSPGVYPIEFLAADGTALASASLTIRKTIFPTQNVTLTPQIEALHTTPDERQTLTTFRDAVSDVKYWDDPLVAPLPGCVISPFGVKRLHNGKPTGEIHAGIDQRGAAGAPIRAVAAGLVKIVQPFNVLVYIRFAPRPRCLFQRRRQRTRWPLAQDATGLGSARGGMIDGIRTIVPRSWAGRVQKRLTRRRPGGNFRTRFR
jgi:hypothetical protein